MTVFNSFFDQGYILVSTDGEVTWDVIANDPEVPEIDKQYRHFFCGQNHFDGAECPNCQKPLLQFYVFDLKDERIGLSGDAFPKLPLLFCWTCEIAQAPFYYQLTASGKVSVLQYKIGEAYNDFPYDNYPAYFPEAFVFLSPLTKKEQKVIASVNRQEIPLSRLRKLDPELFGCQHQLGGEPFLIQRDPEYTSDHPLVCPVCKANMPFFAAVADDCLKDEGFVGNSGVQVLFHLCSKCYVLGAINRCD